MPISRSIVTAMTARRGHPQVDRPGGTACRGRGGSGPGGDASPAPRPVPVPVKRARPRRRPSGRGARRSRRAGGGSRPHCRALAGGAASLPAPHRQRAGIGQPASPPGRPRRASRATGLPRLPHGQSEYAWRPPPAAAAPRGGDRPRGTRLRVCLWRAAKAQRCPGPEELESPFQAPDNSRHITLAHRHTAAGGCPHSRP